MATPNFDKLSKELSLKIFDPVNTGTADGKKFFAEMRANYLNRAYGDLLLIIESIYHDKVKAFSKYYSVIEVATIALGAGYYELTDAYEIEEFYFAKTDGGTMKKASWKEPIEFMNAKHGTNEMNTPDTDNRIWTLIDNQIRVLPSNVAYYDIEMLARNPLSGFTQGGTIDISIRSEFKPLLLELAAREAMGDKGRATQVTIYTALINERKELLGLQTKANEIKGKPDGSS